MLMTKPGLASLTAAVLAVLVLAAPARAETEDDPISEFTASLDAGVWSKYVWRGVNIVDDFVLQPSLDLSYAGFGVNLWGNVDLTDENGERGKLTEWDLTASYSFRLSSVDLSAGAVAYFFPTLNDETAEIFVGAGLDTVLSPSLTLFYDFDDVDGLYALLSAGHTFEDPFALGGESGLSPEVFASVGFGSKNFNEFYYGHSKAGPADLNLGVGIPWKPAETVTLTATVQYSMLLTRGMRRAADKPDNLWFGISVGVEF